MQRQEITMPNVNSKLCAVVGAFVAMLLGVVVVFGPGKKQAQSWFLSGARVGNTVTWGDVMRARKVIAENEPKSKCIRVGREQVSGRNVLYVFTLLELYELEQDASGTWKLKHKGPYNP